MTPLNEIIDFLNNYRLKNGFTPTGQLSDVQASKLQSELFTKFNNYSYEPPTLGTNLLLNSGSVSGTHSYQISKDSVKQSTTPTSLIK